VGAAETGAAAEVGAARGAAEAVATAVAAGAAEAVAADVAAEAGEVERGNPALLRKQKGARGVGGSGILWICATPIGNLGDITVRVAEALGSADLILAEDTRVTRRLLDHLGIATRPERCDENVIRQRSPQIIERIEAGDKVAYVSDAGTPGIADPGMHLVAAAREAACAVEVLPGASAVLCALVASGFVAPAFYFGGFLPRRQTRIVAVLRQLEALEASLVFYESPRRVAASLACIAEVFSGREVVVAREMTKLYEEVLRAPAPELAALIAGREREGRPLKGEVVIVIGPPAKKQTARAHRDKYAPGQPRS
jgi:16S rRNA (cytidine1402-2'-O)-methyltransferase